MSTTARAREQLAVQLSALGELRNASTRDPGFKQWRQNTLTLIQRIWPHEPAKSERFRRVPFSTPSSKMTATVTRDFFERGCAEASAYLRLLLTELDRVVAEEAHGDMPAQDEPPVEIPTLEVIDMPPSTVGEHHSASESRPMSGASDSEPLLIEPISIQDRDPGQGVDAIALSSREMPADEASSREVPPSREAPLSREVQPPLEAPAEVASQESGTREVSAREVPAREVPAREAPPREAPAREVPVREVPAHEVPAAGSTPAGKPAPPQKRGNGKKSQPRQGLRELLGFFGGQGDDESKESDEAREEKPRKESRKEARKEARQETPGAPGRQSLEGLPFKPAWTLISPPQNPRPVEPLHPIYPEPVQEPEASFPPVLASLPEDVDAPERAPLPDSVAGPRMPETPETPETPFEPTVVEMPPMPPADSDDQAASDAAAEFMRSSPVLKSEARPVRRIANLPVAEPSGAVAGPSPTPVQPMAISLSPVANSLVAIAAEVAHLGVPEGQRAAARAALLDLARQVDEHSLTWVRLRESIALLMDYPALARRVLPLLIPYLDAAA